MLEWYEGFMAAIDHILPEKFCMFSSCGGSHPQGKYASRHPERITGLYMASPCGV